MYPTDPNSEKVPFMAPQFQAPPVLPQMPAMPYIPQQSTYPIDQQPILQPMLQPLQQQQPMMMVPKPTTIVTIQTIEYLSCSDVCCRCNKPQYDACACVCGAFTACTGGSAMAFSSCCYGCAKVDCCSVACAGVGMMCTSPFVYGLCAGLIVGFKMMCC